MQWRETQCNSTNKQKAHNNKKKKRNNNGIYGIETEKIHNKGYAGAILLFIRKKMHE